MRIALITLLLAVSGPSRAQGAESNDVFELSLSDLIELEITSASRSSERAIDAPATVIVLTGDELRRRGYRELSEIYNDLPGMDLSRSYGDTYYRNQWRGLRKSIGTPYLLMLDGVIMNHLYFNQEEIIAALPMSSIKQVEVIYGPASAVYGPNAFVGLVNVITRQALEQDGHEINGWVGAGSFENRVADFHYLYQNGQWRVSLAGRFDQGNLDPGQADSYEWTRPEYLQDRSLWGGFVDRRRMNETGSPYYTKALDLRVFRGDSELALQYFTLNTGFGNVYPGDTVHMRSYWTEPELSAYFRKPLQFGPRWSGTMLLRYRESGVGTDSDTLECVDACPLEPDDTVRRINYSRWASENSSWAFNLDMQYQHDERWTLLTGVKAEAKDLQRAYRITYGPTVPADSIILPGDYPDPPEPDFDSIADNRMDTRDTGIYALVKFRAGEWWGWGENHSFLAGIRFDHNSEYGLARTLRGGYVFSNTPWTAKLLYGEAFNEPAQRELYGCWGASGCDPSLEPETARTLEASLTYQRDNYTVLLSAYRLDSANNITTFSGGAANLGDRAIRGVDIHLNARLPIGERPWSLWAYYSYIEAEESVPVTLGSFITRPVGDTSPHKLHLGLTWPVTERFSATLRGRYIGARDTVVTNPAGTVSAYTSFDLTLLHRDWPLTGLGWSLTVLNLTDRTYFHPGLREGNAGFARGFRDSDGVWHGSTGYYNSLMPQEGRGLFLSLLVDF